MMLEIHEAMPLVIWVGLPLALVAAILLRLRAAPGALREEARRAGETLILGPEAASYQGGVRRFGYAKSVCRLALTERRLLARRPIGADIAIPLSEVRAAFNTVSWRGLHHTFRGYLVLTLRDGEEVVFVLRDGAPWIREVSARLAAVPLYLEGVRP